MPALEDAYFLDCGLTYDDVTTTTIAGLGHLEGEVVKVIADGKVHPDRTVALGRILLDYAAAVVHIGFGYTAKLKTLPIEAVLQDGPTMGRLKEVPSAILLVNESVGMKIGPDEDNLDTVIFTDGETFATAESIFSGAYDVNIESGHERQARIIIHHDEGLPLTINAINIEYEGTQ